MGSGSLWREYFAKSNCWQMGGGCKLLDLVSEAGVCDTVCGWENEADVKAGRC